GVRALEGFQLRQLTLASGVLAREQATQHQRQHGRETAHDAPARPPAPGALDLDLGACTADDALAQAGWRRDRVRLGERLEREIVESAILDADRRLLRHGALSPRGALAA